MIWHHLNEDLTYLSIFVRKLVGAFNQFQSDSSSMPVGRRQSDWSTAPNPQRLNAPPHVFFFFVLLKKQVIVQAMHHHRWQQKYFQTTSPRSQNKTYSSPNIHFFAKPSPPGPNETHEVHTHPSAKETKTKSLTGGGTQG